MRAGVDENRLKVFGELWSFLLAVLDDIVGQIEERQLPGAFSWRTNESDASRFTKKNPQIINLMHWKLFYNNVYSLCYCV